MIYCMNRKGAVSVKKWRVCRSTILLICCILCTGCAERTVGESGGVPEDFHFSMVWGVYGISSYDSQTGKLVKTTDAKLPENYIATLKLNEDELTRIYGLISSLDLEAYPDRYDPFNDPKSTSKVYQTPSETWELQVFAEGKEHIISCSNIAPAFADGYNDQAKAFVDIFRQIRDFLMETEEWEALPEYEVFYK